MRPRRTDLSIAEYIAEYDLLRRAAESKMEMGAGSPEQFVSILRMDNAAFSRDETSLEMASCHKSLKFADASANLRGLYGSRGSGSRQDALFTEETVEPRPSDEDSDILAAYRKADKKGVGEKEKEGPRRMVGTRSKGMDKP